MTKCNQLTSLSFEGLT